MRKQEGITLIALVITIIVLLILAGVTIAMLTGENGLLNRATSTKEASDMGTARELISLHVNNQISAYYEKKYVQEKATDSDTIAAAVKAGIADAKADKSWPKNVSLPTDDDAPYTMTYTPSGNSETVKVDPNSGAVTFEKPAAGGTTGGTTGGN